MNTWKRYVPISFAIVFAVISSVGVYHFLKDRAGVSVAATPQMTMIPVVVAKNPIGIGNQIAEHDLEITSWPQEAVPEASFSSVKLVAGKTSRINIMANEPVLESKLLASGENFSSLIPQGLRAITVSIKRSDALAQILERGGTVDVLSLFTFNGTKIITAETIVEKARVISVYKGSVTKSTSGRSQEPEQMEVTLIVTPSEAKRIVAATSQGGIDLVVRND